MNKTRFSISLSIGLLTAFSSLYGCTSNPINSDKPIADSKEKITSMNSLTIHGNNQTLTTQSSLQGNTLALGNIVVKNWPLPQAPCSSCEVKLSRNHHPDGPTVWLSINGEGNSKTWVGSSFQQQFNIDHWELKHKDQQVIVRDMQSKNQMIVAENIQSPVAIMSNKECSILWANKEFLPQPGKNISNDVAQFNSQFIIRCN